MVNARACKRRAARYRCFAPAATGSGAGRAAEGATMDWSDTQEQAAFRDEVRSMIAERLPQRYQSLAQEMHGGERVWQFDRSSDDADAC